MSLLIMKARCTEAEKLYLLNVREWAQGQCIYGLGKKQVAIKAIAC